MGREGEAVAAQPRLPRFALGGERGSAMIETALVLPVLLAIVFGVVMAGRIARSQIAVQAAVREAARTLAAAPSAEEGLAAARERAFAVANGHGLTPELFSVVLDTGGFTRGGTVRAQASYRVRLGDLPLLGRIEVTVSSSHEERVELYRSRTAAVP